MSATIYQKDIMIDKLKKIITVRRWSPSMKKRTDNEAKKNEKD